MRPIPLAVVASLALLAGCTDQRDAQGTSPAAPPALTTAQPPVDMLGTWTDRTGSGFIAIGARQVVIAIDGTARSVSPVNENAIEPGMGAGRIGLADGTALYLARGSTVVDGVPVEHLDVEVVRIGSPAVRRRLLSESGLRLAARIVPTAAPVQIAAPPPVRPEPDAIFLAAVPEGRRPAAEQLVNRASAGAPPAEIAAAFAERQRRAFATVLELLEQSRSLPAEQAAERLQESDRWREETERFSQAWRTWMAGRG